MAQPTQVDGEALQLLTRVNATYKNARTYSDSMEMVDNSDAGYYVMRAQVWLEKGGRGRIETSESDTKIRLLAINDGAFVWGLNPRYLSRYFQMSLPVYWQWHQSENLIDLANAWSDGYSLLTDDRIAARLLTERFSALRLGDLARVDNVPVRRVTMEFGERGNSHYETQTFWISEKDALLRQVTTKIIFEGKPLQSLRETHHHIKLNAAFPATLFAFHPPIYAKPVASFDILRHLDDPEMVLG